MKTRRKYILPLTVLAVLVWLVLNTQSSRVSDIDQTACVAETDASPPISDIFKTNEIIRSIESANSPIDFWGQVLDQNNDPISGAKVRSTIRQWYVRSPVTLAVGAHFIPVERESDSNGRFEIHGERGDGFGIGITKDGYQISPKAPSGFGPVSGSYENPVIFKMWKTGEKAQLADRYAYYWTNGAPCYFNGSAGARTYVNFYNANDFALGKWQTDQDFKPDLGYNYNGTTGVILRQGVFDTPLYFPTETYEIFAYVDPRENSS